MPRRTHRRRSRTGGRRERAGPWRAARRRHVAEAHLRHGPVTLVGLEESERLEAERAGDKRRGEGLQLDVVVPDVAVVEASRELDLVLGRGQGLLQVGEGGDRLQVRVVLGNREQAAQALAQHVLGGAGLGRVAGGARRHGIGTGVGHGLEGAALVAHVALRGVDQVGDEVVASLELDVDLRPCFLGPVPGRDQPVVGEHEPKNDQDDDRDNYPGAHQEVILRVGAPSPSCLLEHLLVLVLAHLLAPLLDYRAQSASKARVSSRRGSKAANHTVSRPQDVPAYTPSRCTSPTPTTSCGSTSGSSSPPRSSRTWKSGRKRRSRTPSSNASASSASWVCVTRPSTAGKAATTSRPSSCPKRGRGPAWAGSAWRLTSRPRWRHRRSSSSGPRSRSANGWSRPSGESTSRPSRSPSRTPAATSRGSRQSPSATATTSSSTAGRSSSQAAPAATGR